MMICSLLAVSLLAGCHDDKDEVTPVEPPLPEADYTVMLYGTGGGNLDDRLSYNLDQVAGYGYTPKVRFTALVKYSADYQEDTARRGTRLYTMREEGMEDEEVHDAGYRMDNPDNLAAFIKDATERLPAKKYILVVWDHGSGFSIEDQPLDWSDFEPLGRSMVYDDNCKDEYGYDECLSIFELEEGLKRSGVKLDMLYWDLCLMNMIENLYQVKDYTRYVLAAAHLTPDMGGNYASLMQALENHPGIEEAAREYVPATMTYWKNSCGLNNLDLTLTDMEKVDAVVESFAPVAAAMRDWKQAMVDERDWLWFDYSQKTAMYLFAGGYTTIDMLHYARYMADRGIGDGMLSAKVTRFGQAMKDMIVVQECFDSDGKLPGDGISIGIQFLRRGMYEYEYPGLKPYSIIYPLTRFDQVTRWSEFLKVNEMKNVVVDEESGSAHEVPWGTGEN